MTIEDPIKIEEQNQLYEITLKNIFGQMKEETIKNNTADLKDVLLQTVFENKLDDIVAKANSHADENVYHIPNQRVETYTKNMNKATKINSVSRKPQHNIVPKQTLSMNFPHLEVQEKKTTT